MRSDLRAAFEQQARVCRQLGSPLTAEVCELLLVELDPRSELGRRVTAWSERAVADALALRLAGGLHALARSGRDAGLRAQYPPAALTPAALRRALAAALRQHEVFLCSYLDSPPQTNEVARCSALLAGALWIAAHTRLPLAWFEIGASAGLNLGFDQYRYELGCGSYGDPNAAVSIHSAWSGALEHAPPLTTPLSVAERAGCDVKPLDPSAREDRERLLSYIWPDQSERLERAEAALALAQRAPWRVAREPASSWLCARFPGARPGQVRTLVHTIVWQYLPREERQAIRELMRAASARATEDAPVAWLSLEADRVGDGAALELALWPGQERSAIARADFHGRWLRWA